LSAAPADLVLEGQPLVSPTNSLFEEFEKPQKELAELDKLERS